MQVGEYYIDPVDGEVKPVMGANAEAAYRAADEDALSRAARARAGNSGEDVWRQREEMLKANRGAFQAAPKPVRGGRGGLIGGIAGGALGGAIGDDPAAEGAIGAAGGYAAERALRALPLDKVMPKGIGLAQMGARAIPGLGLAAQGGTEIYKGVTGNYTPTEEYAERLGLPAPRSVMGDIAVRSLGVGNDVLMGVPSYLMGKFRGRESEPEAPAKSALEPSQAGFHLDARNGDTLTESILRRSFGDNLYEVLQDQPPRPAEQPVEQATAEQPAGEVRQPGYAAPQQPALAPVQVEPQRLPVIQPTEQTVRAATDTFGLQELQDENEAINRLADAYQQRTGEHVPSELSAMDKFQILAKGLGVGLLVAAFPGFGIAAGLGLGLAAGGDELGQRRSALAAGDQQEFENDQTRLANVMEMAKARRQNLLDQISIRTGAEERAERTRQADREFGLSERELGLKQQQLSQQAQRLQQEGYSRIIDDTGEVVFVRAGSEPIRSGIKAQAQQGLGARGAFGVAYNPLEDIRSIADNLDPALPYETRMDMAAEQAARYARGFNAGVPGFQPTQQSAVQQPRLAPDGNYYVPDPNSPSGWSRVDQ